MIGQAMKYTEALEVFNEFVAKYARFGKRFAIVLDHTGAHFICGYNHALHLENTVNIVKHS